ncbi:MAG TPA: hypothetical protein VNZ48_11440, partial [Xanthobacteraceae bacterium]|nr:hypothetical protein [Xanthobacteraceae bacterium]
MTKLLAALRRQCYKREFGLNPDLAADFGVTALIRALSRGCFGPVSGLIRIRIRIPSPSQGKAC